MDLMKKIILTKINVLQLSDEALGYGRSLYLLDAVICRFKFIKNYVSVK